MLKFFRKIVASALLASAALSAPAWAQYSDRAPSERAPDPAKTENFRVKRYGVFFHYLNSLQNNPKTVNSLGKETSWNECVAEFDVEKFAEQVAETGAGYAFFTMEQQTRFMPAPNATFDRLTGYKPGEACSTRDLIAEIADALEERGIDLYLYWTGDGPLQDEKAMKGLSGAIPVTNEYMRNWSDVVAEFGERYGEKVKGWWVDGSYSWIGHNEETRGILAQGLRAGAPNRVLAFNPGVDPKVSAYSDLDDFTAGEQNSFESLPETGRFLKGAQWHILTFLGHFWGEPGTKLSKTQLAQYVWTANKLGGVVTIDMVLFRDGGLDRSQLETVKALRPLLAEKDARVASGNLAADAIAFLRSADDERALIPSCGEIHSAEKGIDGDQNTYAQGGGEWSWAYRVNLSTVGKAKKINLRFGECWATDFEIFIKPTEGDWESLGRFENPDGMKEYEVEFEPKEISAVKVVAYKPDDEGQTGVQMSVAELEIY